MSNRIPTKPRLKLLSVVLTEEQVEEFEGLYGVAPHSVEDYQCEHDWVQTRTKEITEYREVVLRTKWVDGPDDLGGDIVFVHGSGPWIQQREPTKDIPTIVQCRKCNAFTEVGA